MADTRHVSNLQNENFIKETRLARNHMVIMVAQNEIISEIYLCQLSPSMPINIVPIVLLQVLSHLVIPFRSLNDPHIQISYHESILSPHLSNLSHNRECNLRQAQEILRRSGSVDENNTTGILKAAGCNGRLEEQTFAIWVICAGFGGGIMGGPWNKFQLDQVPRTSTDQKEFNIQYVGTITICAPSTISSRNASGNARSQHISIPTRPIGVSIATWGSGPEEVRWGRSGCQMFFLR
jgi:hypothetical protein